jgi:hypothetical protein
MPSLSEPLLKLKRAHEHLAALRGELETFMRERPYPYAIVANKAPEDPIHFVRLRVLREPPARLGLIIGDFAHNARAALDYLAWQLSLIVKPNLTTLPSHERPVTEIEFPIFLKRPKVPLQSNKRLQFVPHEAKGEIESLQPYNRIPPASAPWEGPHTDWLWVLYRLSNRDKHRQIAPIGLRVRFIINPGTAPTGFLEHVAPFKDGHVLRPLPSELVEDRKGALKIEPSFDVLFSEAGLAEGVGIDALGNLHDYIRDGVFPRFTGFFK